MRLDRCPLMIIAILGCVLCGASRGDESLATAAKAITQAGGRLAFSVAPADGTIVGVDFCGASVDERPLEILRQLPGIKTLNLTGARISDQSLRHLAHLKRLESLTLMGSGVGDEGMRHLAALPSLRHLDLTGTRVGDAGLAHLAALRELRTLRLAGTLVTDAGMSRLRVFKDLRTLDLFGTQVAGPGVRQLDALSELRELDVYHNPDVPTGDTILDNAEAAILDLVSKKAFPHIEVLNFSFKALKSSSERRRSPFGSWKLDDLNLQALANCPRLLSLDLWVDAPSDFLVLKSLKDLQSLTLHAHWIDVDAKWPENAWSPLDNLTKLESLVIGEGLPVGRGLEHIARLQNLRRLTLPKRQFRGESLKGLTRLASLNNLRCLELCGNELGPDGLASLSELKHLERLDGNLVDDDGLMRLSKLNSLRSLDLSWTHLSASSLPYLRNLPCLEALSLLHAEINDESLKHLRGLSSLRWLDLRNTNVTEEGVKALRRDLPALETVRWGKEGWEYLRQPPSSDRESFLESILVQAMVLTSSVDAFGDRTRGIITQVYLGPPSLRGQSFIAHLPFAHKSAQYTSLEHTCVATNELVLTFLVQGPDGTLVMPLSGTLTNGSLMEADYTLAFGYPWPVWLAQTWVGSIGPGMGDDPIGQERRPDYQRQREVAELLRAAAERPEPQRIAFLLEQLISGSDLQASTAIQLLRMDPIDDVVESHLIRRLFDQSVPMLRRILIDKSFVIDQKFLYGVGSLSLAWPLPWAYSSERITLLKRWARDVTSAEEAESLAVDLQKSGGIASDLWESEPEPKKLALGLIEAIEAIQSHPKASVNSKSQAVQAVDRSLAAVARDEAFEPLARWGQNSPHIEVRSAAAAQLSRLTPYSPKEAAQLRKVLQASLDEVSRAWLEKAIAKPKQP